MSTNPLNRDALVVGICQYDDLPMSQQLHTLAEQAEAMAKLLETQGGFKVTRLPCAADLTLDLNRRVTLPELKQAIAKLLYPPAESPTQTALLFFAGHGLFEETRLGKEGFLATSEADGKSVYGVSLKWLRGLLRNSTVKQQIVFLESCNSGAFFTDFQADKEHDYCFVTSARANEEALANGLLTQELLNILDYTKQSEDLVTSDMLIKRLQKREPVLKGWQRFMWRTHGQPIVLSGSVSYRSLTTYQPVRGNWLKMVMVIGVAIILLGGIYGINKLLHNDNPQPPSDQDKSGNVGGTPPHDNPQPPSDQGKSGNVGGTPPTPPSPPTNGTATTGSKEVEKEVPLSKLETLQREAETGDQKAQTDLGIAYYQNQHGAGINYEKASKWFEKAAKEGYAEAQYHLSIMYAKGQHVPNDQKKSFELLKQSAENGHPAAQYYLGTAYRDGLLGLHPDKDKALTWIGKAAEQAFAGTLAGLSASPDLQAFVDWVRKSAAEGNADAQFILGVLYETGIGGVPQDLKEAIQWFEKAARQGHIAARKKLEELSSKVSQGDTKPVTIPPSSGPMQNPSPKEDLKQVAPPMQEKQVRGEPVAFVENINCTPNDFEIIREGKLVPSLAPYALLYPYDKIIVLRKQSAIENNECFVTLFLSKEKPVTVTSSKSPYYVVRNKGGDNTVTQVFDPKDWEWFEGQFRDLWSYHIRYISALRSGPERRRMMSSIPLLQKDVQLLVEGQRRLYLGWDGGESTYEVRLFSIKDGTTRAEERAEIKMETNNDDVVIENFTFLTGHRYRITVSDAARIRADFNLGVVNERSFTLLDKWDAGIIKNSNLPPRVKTTLLAMWLVSEGDGIWNLEAYQRVVALLKEEKDYYPAIWLKEGLKRGWVGDDKARPR